MSVERYLIEFAIASVENLQRGRENGHNEALQTIVQIGNVERESMGSEPVNKFKVVLDVDGHYRVEFV